MHLVGRCDVNTRKTSGIFRLASIGFSSLGATLGKLAIPSVLTYGYRFKEMRRDHEAIEHTRQLSVTHSQLARQAPK